MYPPMHFQEHNSERLQALVEQFPLASILTPCLQSDLNNICQVPVLYEPSRNVFIAHVAKNNPLTQCDKRSVKLHFNGDNCYLSPSYSNNKTLPSWLYCSLEVLAKVEIVECNNQKHHIMQRLTSHFEESFEPKWQLNKIPIQSRERLYQQLCFINFKPIHWSGNFKLSQNKPEDTRMEIKKSLVNANKHSIAEMI
ncbi:FMN-binding negative transcriptional regulator [Pseudoalteromonas sp. 10-33]|uniref:FMN-binding negative transcriptional regulator n=1 Tax=Pseudoalteromonas sp. 10-33 TaxID=1761890 RepID=UPI00073223D1|nr:FMN-binding negative transcriptional regulator [Pseudoalteromonas sp. 10-33]KTF11392.1 transcriptional regulator [Pseudoalteromonas sp. 10-33]